MLRVDGGTKGDASNALAFLRSKPLRQFIGGYLDGLDAAGPTDSSLHLVLPVENLDKFLASLGHRMESQAPAP